MKPRDLREETEFVSRSARKREAQATKAFGERLAELNADQLKSLDLPEELLEAILDFQRFTSHAARRRQMLLIGKYLRELDETEIAERAAVMVQADSRSIWRHHQAELWRDRLADEDDSLAAFLDEHPTIDRDELKTLLRRLRAARDEPAVRTCRRALYRFIHEQL